MEKTVKVDCRIFNPGVPNANGRIYDEEMFSKAVKDYLDRGNQNSVYGKQNFVYFDDNKCGPFNHKLEDVCGTIDHVNRNEDNSFTANITLFPSTYRGKMVCDLINNENIDTSRMCITPDGFYDPENEKLTITTYSVSFEKK